MGSRLRPKVSVIMPSLNVAPYIQQCMESVVRQTLRDIEIICVDAGSVDGTADILNAFAQKDDRVVLIHSPLKSYGHQMNMGIKAATGEYIGVVETDDFASLDMFETLYKAASHYQVQVVKSSYYRYSAKQGSQEKIVYPYMELPYNRPFHPERHPKILLPEPAIWSGLYQREFLIKNKIGFLETPGAAYQDTSFILKVWFFAQRVAILKPAFLHYRIDNEHSSVNSSEKAFEVCLEFRHAQEILDQYPDKKSLFQAYLIARKEYGYYWNYMRLYETLKPGFFDVYRKEFAGKMEMEKWQLKALSHQAKVRVKALAQGSDVFRSIVENSKCSGSILNLTDHSFRYIIRRFLVKDGV